MVTTSTVARRFPSRHFQPRFIIVAFLLLALAYLTLGCWLLSSWNDRTINAFLRYARDGDIVRCRAMLVEDSTDGYQLDDANLQFAGRLHLKTEPRSFMDFVRGRQCFSVSIAYANDHSFTVEAGRVRLGSGFWILSRPESEFKLVKQIMDGEQERLRKHDERDRETKPSAVLTEQSEVTARIRLPAPARPLVLSPPETCLTAKDESMLRKTAPTLLACALLVVAISAGCQQKVRYASGVGGNLVPVKQEPDGTWLFVPVDEVEKYRQAEKVKAESASMEKAE